MEIQTDSSRLVTQNLLVSAAAADANGAPGWSAVQDLAALIDMCCLYDRIVVLGREVNAFLGLGSPVLNLIAATGLLRIDFPHLGYEEAIANSAKHHLLTYLGEKDLGDFDRLVRFALMPDGATYGLCDAPDGMLEVEEGDAWLRTTPRNRDLLQQLKCEDGVARSTTFLVRSFLYIAYADFTGLVFVPDSARAGLVGDVATMEQGVRASLLKSMTSTSAEIFGPAPPQLARLSNLAAVVFERSKGRRQIAEEVERLRNELASLRARLNKAEQIWRFGKGDEVVRAATEWRLVIGELARSYGEQPHLVSLEQILGFGANVGELADGSHKSKAWVSFLLGLPFEVVRRVLLRRPAIELHRLRKNRPGVGRLAATVERLFGTRLR